MEGPGGIELLDQGRHDLFTEMAVWNVTVTFGELPSHQVFVATDPEKDRRMVTQPFDHIGNFSFSIGPEIRLMKGIDAITEVEILPYQYALLVTGLIPM